MKIILTFLILIIVFKAQGQEIKDIIEKSIAEIDKIESFEYIEISKGTAAFDTTEFVSEYLSKVIGVSNIQDTIIGYNYISNWRDTSKVYSVYNFDYEVNFNWDSKSVEIIDYSEHLDLRLTNYAPFYVKARTLLDFGLYGNQAKLNIESNTNDTIVLFINFPKNRYEFQGKIVSKQSRDGYAWSNYTVWIDKKSFLPVKILRKNEYHKSIREILSYKINSRPNYKINALESIPENFSIYEYGKSRKPSNLVGKAAPDFKLLSATQDSISLSDYFGKVVLIEFTSIGCGPCQLAIPELDKLYSEYDKNKFEILSVESYLFNRNDVFQRYITKKGITYPFLVGNREITDLYKIFGVPYFLIIDKKGIIQGTYSGFTKEETVPKIKKSIEILLK